MTMYTLHMTHADFDCWRDHARQLLAARVSPGEVLWQSDDSSGDLFASEDTDLPPPDKAPLALTISKQDLRRLECASHYWPAHHQECRWALLYRVVWRLAQGEGDALLAGDADGAIIEQRVKAVSHEVHHIHAFLRFHPQPVHVREQHAPEFTAWFEPRHDVLEEAARHFIDRMGQHRWLIMTPEGTIVCNGRQWHIERPESGAFTVQDYQALSDMKEDAEDLWLAYYASTFNPARLNKKTMVRSMPSRFWRHLPERVLITGLINHARHGARRLGQDSRLAERRGRTITPPR